MTRMNDSRVHRKPSAVEIPSAKTAGTGFTGIHAWLKYYAGFSPEFVARITEFLHLGPKSLVFDPFAGTGTTNVVCKSMNIPSIGMELNPASYVVAKAKLCWNLNPAEVRRKLRWLRPNEVESPPTVESDDGEIFSNKAGRYLLSVARKTLGFHEEARFFLLASVLETLRKVVVVKFGTNPTWPKRKYRRTGSPRDAHKILSQIVEERLRDIAHYKSLADCPAEVLYGDSTEFVPKFKVDAVITSPPYLNRLDYVMNYLLENRFLLALKFPSSLAIDELRAQMLGTVKIADGPAPIAEWGRICCDLLETIRLHPSKAAHSYYYKTISRYFDGIYRSLLMFHRMVRNGGTCCIVVQTSYFKNLELSLPEMIAEMASNIGYREVEFLREDLVSSHLGRTDPDQRRWKQVKLLTEKVVLLKR